MLPPLFGVSWGMYAVIGAILVLVLFLLVRVSQRRKKAALPPDRQSAKPSRKSAASKRPAKVDKASRYQELRQAAAADSFSQTATSNAYQPLAAGPAPVSPQAVMPTGGAMAPPAPSAMTAAPAPLVHSVPMEEYLPGSDPVQGIIYDLLAGWGDLTQEDTNRLSVFRPDRVMATVASTDIPRDLRSNEYARTRLSQLRRWASGLEHTVIAQQQAQPLAQPEYAGIDATQQAQPQLATTSPPAQPVPLTQPVPPAQYAPPAHSGPPVTAGPAVASAPLAAAAAGASFYGNTPAQPTIPAAPSPAAMSSYPPPPNGVDLAPQYQATPYPGQAAAYPQASQPQPAPYQQQAAPYLGQAAAYQEPAAPYPGQAAAYPQASQPQPTAPDYPQPAPTLDRLPGQEPPVQEQLMQQQVAQSAVAQFATPGAPSELTPQMAQASKSTEAAIAAAAAAFWARPELGGTLPDAQSAQTPPLAPPMPRTDSQATPGPAVPPPAAPGSFPLGQDLPTLNVSTPDVQAPRVAPAPQQARPLTSTGAASDAFFDGLRAQVSTADALLALPATEQPDLLPFLKPSELAKVLRSTADGGLKIAVIDALENIGSATALDAIYHCLNDPDPQIQAKALEAADRLLGAQ